MYKCRKRALIGARQIDRQDQDCAMVSRLVTNLSPHSARATFKPIPGSMMIAAPDALSTGAASF
jgi:hypothetical protein